MATKTGLDALSPAYREQYEAALPEIQRKAREAAQARGMFYSGDSLDSETRAEAELLAQLSGESAAATHQTQENALTRQQNQDLANQQNAAGKRAQTLGIIGTGLGAAGTLAGLKYLTPGQNMNNVIMGQDGKPYLINMKTGVMTPATMPGAAAPIAGGVGGASMSPAGGGGLDALAGTPSVPGDYTPGMVAGGVGGAAAPAAAVAAPAGALDTMWKNAKGVGVGGLAAGAAGGLAGNYLSSKIGGGHSLAGDIGSGAGGLAGGLAMLNYSDNPWMAGLGALGGSLGGGLIGNLFK